MGSVRRRAWRAALLAVLLFAGGLALLPGESLASVSMAAPRLSSGAVGSLTVAWDVPSPVPASYRIMWAPEDGDWLSWRYANETERGNLYPRGRVSTQTITGLKPGGRYKVMMRARFSNSAPGPWSPSSAIEVRGAPRLSSGAVGSLTVAWDVPSPAPASYRIMWAPEDGDWLSWRYANETERGNLYPRGRVSTETITGLEPGGRYKVKMRARYSNKAPGPWSTSSVLRVMAAPPSPSPIPKGNDKNGDGNRIINPRQNSSVATLSALSVSPKNIVGFSGDSYYYEVGVASTVTTATVTATATDSTNATIAITPADADSNASNHQVSLRAGRNTVRVTVTAQDGTTTQTYKVSINRGVTDAYGWKASDDIDALNAAGNSLPRGIWSDGTTIWISDAMDDKLYAYKKSDKSRDSSKDFNTLAGAGNNHPTGIWSDGTTMWVADYGDDKIFAYKMSDKSRDSSKDFTTTSLTAANLYNPYGLWSDGTTMWIGNYYYNKLFAYKMSDRTRDPSKDFNDVFGHILWASRRGAPYGIWGNSTTMWIVDQDEQKIRAFKRADKTRDSSKDFFNSMALAFNSNPHGIWSDGTTLWVVDPNDRKVYSYNLPQ